MIRPELLSVLIKLTPTHIPEGYETPRWWGGYAHGLLMNALGAHDPELGEKYHAMPGYKPFTVSDLIGIDQRRPLTTDTEYGLRFTSLEPTLTECLIAILASGTLAPGKTVHLGPVAFNIVSHDCQDPDWCGLTDYQSLSKESLMPGGKLPRRIMFQFGSPTCFKQSSRFDPLPTPGLVFGGLLRRWNHWSPVAFPEAVKDYAAECLVTSRFTMKTRLAGMKDGGFRPGAVGRVAYSTLNYDGYWMSLLHALAAYARYAGIGSGVTQGMGQATKL